MPAEKPPRSPHRYPRQVLISRDHRPNPRSTARPRVHTSHRFTVTSVSRGDSGPSVRYRTQRASSSRLPNCNHCRVQPRYGPATAFSPLLVDVFESPLPKDVAVFQWNRHSVVMRYQSRRVVRRRAGQARLLHRDSRSLRPPFVARAPSSLAPVRHRRRHPHRARLALPPGRDHRDTLAPGIRVVRLRVEPSLRRSAMQAISAPTRGAN